MYLDNHACHQWDRQALFLEEEFWLNTIFWLWILAFFVLLLASKPCRELTLRVTSYIVRYIVINYIVRYIVSEQAGVLIIYYKNARLFRNYISNSLGFEVLSPSSL